MEDSWLSSAAGIETVMITGDQSSTAFPLENAWRKAQGKPLELSIPHIWTS
jgi:hypothetical protein